MGRRCVGVEKFCGDRCRDFHELLGDDPGAACDILFRHYRDEYWPRVRRVERPVPLLRGSIQLPKPELPTRPVGQVIVSRRSVREYSPSWITLSELSTVLYLSAGVTVVDEGWPLRATPSAGALHSTEVFVYADRVEGLEKGIYYYDWLRHSLAPISRGDYSQLLADIALEQEHVGDAASTLILVANYGRVFGKYWKRAYRYVLLDAGAVMQNAYLAATALGLGACAVGAFYDEELCNLLRIDCRNMVPVLLLTLGKPRKSL